MVLEGDCCELEITPNVPFLVTLVSFCHKLDVISHHKLVTNFKKASFDQHFFEKAPSKLVMRIL
jgi:hypothetical protein